MRQAGMDRKIRLVYILAASHSGSTLLAMLLGRHPDICTVGELKLTSMGDVDRYRCSCRELIRECPFWKEVSGEMARKGFPFDMEKPGTHFGAVRSGYANRLLKPLHRGPLSERVRDTALTLSPEWRSHLEKVQSRNAALMECLLERTGKDVIVDSSKIGLRLKYLLRNPRLDVRIIRVIRDGRSVALTYHDPSRFADATDPSLRCGGRGESMKRPRLTIAEGAREWRRSNEEAETILESLPPSRWIESRYETLCGEPDATLDRLFSFIGVDPAGVLTNQPMNDHHVVGNGMRLDRAPEIRLDDRWRTVLTAEDLATFDREAGSTNRRLGYE